LGTAGYFLWLGLSAMLVGLVLSALPIGWQMQWISFASFSLLTTWQWWRYQFKKDRAGDKNSTLNHRDRQLIGKTARLEEDVLAGECRIRLGDTTWSAKSECDLKSGTLVEVTKVDGIVLTIVEKQ
jgi:membrane protein implicated in regulation of membrane protease activity